jgi:hypothetical protein
METHESRGNPRMLARFFLTSIPTMWIESALARSMF